MNYTNIISTWNSLKLGDELEFTKLLKKIAVPYRYANHPNYSEIYKYMSKEVTDLFSVILLVMNRTISKHDRILLTYRYLFRFTTVETSKLLSISPLVLPKQTKNAIKNLHKAMMKELGL